MSSEKELIKPIQIMQREKIIITPQKEDKMGEPSEWQPASPRTQELAKKVRFDVEAKHGKGSEYVAEQYTWVVVAGTAYHILICLDPGWVVNVRVIVPLKGAEGGDEPYVSEIKSPTYAELRWEKSTRLRWTNSFLMADLVHQACEEEAPETAGEKSEFMLGSDTRASICTSPPYEKHSV